MMFINSAYCLQNLLSLIIFQYSAVWLKLRFCLLLMMTCLIVEMLSHLKIEILEYTDTDLYYILHRLADHNLLDLMFLNLCCVDNALDKVIKNKTPL